MTRPRPWPKNGELIGTLRQPRAFSFSHRRRRFQSATHTIRVSRWTTWTRNSWVTIIFKERDGQTVGESVDTCSAARSLITGMSRLISRILEPSADVEMLGLTRRAISSSTIRMAIWSTVKPRSAGKSLLPTPWQYGGPMSHSLFSPLVWRTLEKGQVHPPWSITRLQHDAGQKAWRSRIFCVLAQLAPLNS
jgi:hypothetical protein